MEPDVIELTAYDTREQAIAAQDDLAATLAAMGNTDRFGVFVRYRSRRGWTVFLRDRSPTEEE